MARASIIFICIIFVALSTIFFDRSLIDDSYINYRYAENLALHGELNWNLGERPVVEGYSNFLWIVLLALIIKVGLPVIFTSKVIGILFGMGCVIFLYLIARQYTQDRFFSLFPAVLLSITAPLLFWASSGMETSMFLFLLLLSVYFFVRELFVAKKCYYSGICLALAALTRHEGAVVFVLSAGFVFLFNMFARKHSQLHIKMSLVRYCVSFLALYLPYFAWRVWYFGDIFPNSLHTKKALFMGLGDILYGFIYMLPVIIFALFMIREEWRHKSEHNSNMSRAFILRSYYIVVISGFLAVLLNLNTIMGLNFRFMLPTFAFFFLLAVPAVSLHKEYWIKLIAVVVMFWVIGFGFFPYNTLHKNVYSVAGEDLAIMHRYEVVGEYLRSVPDASSKTIALGEAGVIPYRSKMRVIDLLGLNDLYLSRHPNDADYVLSKKPDYIFMSCTVAEKCLPNGFAIYPAIAAHPQFLSEYTLIKSWDEFELYGRKG